MPALRVQIPQVQVQKKATGELLKSDKFLALVNNNKSQAQINQEIQEFWWRIGNQTVLRALSQMQGAFNLKTRLLETRQEAWRQFEAVQKMKVLVDRDAFANCRAVQKGALCSSRRELSKFKRVFICKIWLRYSQDRALLNEPRA